LVNAVEVILISCSMLVIPPTLAIAILHSRLWDIDVIINRTLVYSFLTATLALVYIGLVIGLQFLLRGLTEGNQLAIIGSTLIIAALFQPLRQRIQIVIDRRFYRHKYDATRTLEAFSATLRNELDLEQLSEQLTSVVEETMQPRHVSLWLRKPEQKKGAPLTGNPLLLYAATDIHLCLRTPLIGSSRRSLNQRFLAHQPTRPGSPQQGQQHTVYAIVARHTPGQHQQ
jgi:hypothetical protein